MLQIGGSCRASCHRMILYAQSFHKAIKMTRAQRTVQKMATLLEMLTSVQAYELPTLILSFELLHAGVCQNYAIYPTRVTLG